MLAELDVVVFLRSNDDLARVAERVFGALASPYEETRADEQTDVPAYRASGLGFEAVLYPNEGDLLDPEFEEYGYSLEIMSQFWCVELDTVDLEGPLSEYYARQLAFDLDLETATELLLETTEEEEVFEIRAYRRNPQYRLDQAPTTPKVFVVETREYRQGFDEGEEWDVDGEDEDEDEEMVAPGEQP